MTRSKRPFEPLEPGKVKMYACGPTVYGDPHIGNFSSFVSADLLRRWLEYRGYDVTMIMNVTDIDDKTIRDSAKAGEPIKEFTQKLHAQLPPRTRRDEHSPRHSQPTRHGVHPPDDQPSSRRSSTRAQRTSQRTASTST